MDIHKIVNELKTEYPEKNIIVNEPGEIICEIEPTSEHAEFSIAVAVVDSIIPHYHNYSVEEYEIIKGTLEMQLDGHTIFLGEAESIRIDPGVVHTAKGSETWFRVISKPGWNTEDHILISDETG